MQGVQIEMPKSRFPRDEGIPVPLSEPNAAICI